MLDMTLKIELIFRLFASLIAGVAIGLERENRNKDAGMKTHALVALGSAMAMVVSKYGFSDGAGGDMSRIAAQVISGIGFIGAGVIFVKRDTIVRGLTTAAGLWVTAAIALALGAGMYLIGTVATLLVVSFQYFFYKEIFKIRKPREATVKLSYKDHIRTTHIIRTLVELDIHIIHERIIHNFDKNFTQLTLDIEMPQDMTVRQLQKIAGSFEGLISFECSVYN